MEQTWRKSSRIREPATLLKPIKDPAEWYPEELQEGQWIYSLNPSEVSEILAAVDQVSALNIALANVTAKDFALPTFAKTLHEIKDELMNGRGFALLRGLPRDKMSKEQMAIAFWGIGSHLGDVVPQNQQGHRLGHVKDIGKDYSRARGYMSSQAMGFHADPTDILSLGCLSTAKSGGEHRICSTVSLYNKLLKEDPELVKTLTFRFYREPDSAPKPGEAPWVRQPIFSVQNGYFSARGAGAHLMKAQKIPGVPALTEKQKQAIQHMKEVAAGIALDIPFQPGDISYVMNHVSFHARTDFEDWPEPERKRHLLRLWISNGERPLIPDIKNIMAGVKTEDVADPTPMDVN